MTREESRMVDTRKTVLIVLALLVASAWLPRSAEAQWLNYKTPGVPRTADGKPNLAAPTPRTPYGKPDLSGNWRADTAGFAETGVAQDSVKLLPWAATLTEQRKETIGRDSPSTMCLPSGPTVDQGVGKVVQTRHLLLMLWNGTAYREIFLDGRDLPKDPNPDWMGYSVGHWEGDTLVIVSAGFNDRTWLDDDGRPHTEQLRITERLKRTDYGHMQITRTFTDPGALAEPWTVPVKLELDPDNEQLEYVCNENERDRDHLVGKASDDKGVDVPPTILAKYIGNYEMKIPSTDKVMSFAFVIKDDHLVLTGSGPSTPLTATSETEFSAPGLALKFVTDDKGVVTHAVISAVEGDFKAIKK